MPGLKSPFRLTVLARMAGKSPTCCAVPSEAGNGAEHLPDPHAARVPDAGRVEPTVVSKTPPPGKAPEGMVWIPRGRYSMGSDYGPFEDSRPIHAVELDGFWMDRTTVTNAQFEKFVKTDLKDVASAWLKSVGLVTG